MTATGHSERAAQIVEQIRKRHETREIQTREVHHELDRSELAQLAVQIKGHFDTLQTRINALQGRVDELEKRPLAVVPENDRDVVPEALGKMHLTVEGFNTRLAALEQAMDEPITITATGHDVSPDEIQHLKSSVEEVGSAALKATTVLVKRLDALEARMANYKLELAEDMLREIRRA